MSSLKLRFDPHPNGCLLSALDGSDTVVLPLCQAHARQFLQRVYPLFALTPSFVLELVEISSFVRFVGLAWAYEAGEPVPQAFADFYRLADGLDFGEADVSVDPIH